MFQRRCLYPRMVNVLSSLFAITARSHEVRSKSPQRTFGTERMMSTRTAMRCASSEAVRMVEKNNAGLSQMHVRLKPYAQGVNCKQQKKTKHGGGVTAREWTTSRGTSILGPQPAQWLDPKDNFLP